MQQGESEVKPKKRETFHIIKTPQLSKMISEIQKVRGSSSAAEVIRFCITQYYVGDFRKEQYGYQAGSKTAERRIAKAEASSELENTLMSLDGKKDEEVTNLLLETGYLSNANGFMMEDGDWRVRINDAGKRVLTLFYRGSDSKADIMTWEELKGGLEKFLRAKQNVS